MYLHKAIKEALQLTNDLYYKTTWCFSFENSLGLIYHPPCSRNKIKTIGASLLNRRVMPSGAEFKKYSTALVL